MGTKRIYLDDSRVFEFQSMVLANRAGNDCREIILEETAFYPESGGQLYDIGVLDGRKVLSVREDEEGNVVHCVEEWSANVGDIVIGEVDRKRRLDNMRKHTGQHILSRAFIEVAAAETVSSRLGEKESTIELSRSSIDYKLVEKAEILANEIIMLDLPIMVAYHSKDELNQMPIRKIPERTGIFRIVKIGEFDYTACGGTHCSRSGEVGLIKIIGQENLRGHVRLIFLAGRPALEDYIEKHREISALSASLTCHFKDLTNAVDKLKEQNSAYRREISHLSGKILFSEIEEALNEASKISGIAIAVKEYKNQDIKTLRDTIAKIIESRRAIILIIINGKAIVATSPGVGPTADEMARTIVKRFGGKGGGGATIAQVGGMDQEKLIELGESFEEIAKNGIESII
jgi:alanyl-tRNA synthetase